MKKFVIASIVLLFGKHALADIVLGQPFSGIEKEARTAVLCIRAFGTEYDKFNFNPAFEAIPKVNEHLAEIIQKSHPVDISKLKRPLTEEDIRQPINPVSYQRLSEAISSGITWKFPNQNTKEHRLYTLAFTCNRYIPKESESWADHIASLKG